MYIHEILIFIVCNIQWTKKKPWQKRQKNDRNPHVFVFFNKNILIQNHFIIKWILKNSNRLSLYWYLRVRFMFLTVRLLFNAFIWKYFVLGLGHITLIFVNGITAEFFLPFILLEKFFSFFFSSFSSFQRLIHAVAYSTFSSYQSLICVVAYLTFLW